MDTMSRREKTSLERVIKQAKKSERKMWRLKLSFKTKKKKVFLFKYDAKT